MATPERGVPEYVNYIAHVIGQQYNDEASVLPAGQSVYRFGRNRAVGTAYEIIWEIGGTETLPTTNAIDRISSTSAADNQEIRVSGFTLSDGNLTRVVQVATLNGQTPVALSTPLARACELININGTDLAGDVYAYQQAATVVAGEPQEANLTHILIDGSGFENRSFKAACATQSTEYYVVTEFTASVLEKNSAFADFEFQVKRVDGAWRTESSLQSSSSSGTVAHKFDPPLIVPPNYDIRIRASADGSNTFLAASFSAYTARIR